MLRFRVWLIVVLGIWVLGTASRAADPVMYAHEINVGQGSASLLEFPCGCVLIDTGAQDEQHVDHLVNYLQTFFARRSDLHGSIDVVIISHPHKDHTWGLEAVARNFNIRNFVDDGVFQQGSGKRNVKWIRDQVASGMLHTTIRPVRDDEITALPDRKGLSDDVIDPLVCADCDPQIRILSGGMDVNPGWSSKDFKNFNNHSVVVRIDFGESSFLYTGDLELPAIQTLVNYYRDTDMLDVDVYHVGHHGSHNATNEALLEATTPIIATIGVGHWSYGAGSTAFGINTHSFGHPRRVTLDLLEDYIPGNRSQPINIQAGIGVHQFQPYTVRKKVYASGWDGDFRIRADLAGNMRVEHVRSTQSPLEDRAVPEEAELATRRARDLADPQIDEPTEELRMAARSAGANRGVALQAHAGPSAPAPTLAVPARMQPAPTYAPVRPLRRLFGRFH